MDESGRRRQQWRNHPSSSSSSTGHTRFRSQQYSSNPTKTTRSSNFVPRSTTTTGTTPHNTRNPGYVPKWKSVSNANNQQEGETEAGEEVGSIVGTCPFMCPEGERAQRERLRDLAIFERLNGDPRKTSAALAVKKFCRTISLKYVQASDVRPLSVLEDTLNYLLNLLDWSEHPFEVVHDFIFDRTRSIRQDLGMQNIVNDRAICMYEKMVKFHAVSHHRLQNCGSSSISSLQYLNMEQLMKTLASLYTLYEANHSSNSISENEAEFRSFYVLLHLDSKSQQREESLSFWFRRVPSLVMKSKEMHFARQVLRFYRMGNYRSFLCTVSAEASYLQYCIIEPYVNEVRALAVSYINNCCYKLHPYPLEHLSKLLMMKESDMESFCHACGLKTLSDDGGNKLLPTKQTTFCNPKGSFQSCSILGLEQYQRGGGIRTLLFR
ncbi:SAC3/GANP/Nin1/mts3/eIF-3 p25 family isoform 2 [Theobroma cacao]|uniref:SAC3/GANP/Nin1/mts3/eIF-3 p25 family isoform 2 n=1 Tax=Theobroma cacao TaxID=3641 RepID=A0A061FS75_THECC|nr:SAC3/GANP/Nin1/mts3/eIF-3 p25 family isoform 2 [Theobroma cacao]